MKNRNENKCILIDDIYYWYDIDNCEKIKNKITEIADEILDKISFEYSENNWF
jgi:hypothetical protein